jgi:pimeloyl-ACP methyl ester carboxylesterase
LPPPSDHLIRAWLRLKGFSSRRVRTSVGVVHALDGRGGGPLPPLVLLHGFSASCASYLPLLPRVRGSLRRVLLPDLPGHGFSDVPAGGVHSATLKSGLFEALDALLEEPAFLFGNSLGAVPAIRYALERPGRVRGIVLCSPGGAALEPRELASLLSVFQLAGHGEALAFVDRLFAKRAPLRHLIAWGVRRRFMRKDMRSLLASVTPDDLLTPEQLAALRMPVLLIWGRAERIFPGSHLDYFRRHLPASTLFEAPEGCGHSPYLDRPGAIARSILGFMGRNANQ